MPLRFEFTVDVGLHIAYMLNGPMKKELYELPPTILAVPELVSNLVGKSKHVLAVVRPMLHQGAGGLTDGDHDVITFLYALIAIVGCGLADDRARPATVDARMARKSMIAFAKMDNALGELGKCMSTYVGAKALMGRAREHAAGGIQDENASAMYDEAVSRFESKLGGGFFDDTQAFVLTGNEGGPHTIDSYEDLLVATKAMATDAMHVISQWSSAALQSRLVNLADFVSVAMDVVRLGLHILVNCTQDSLADSWANLEVDRTQKHTAGQEEVREPAIKQELEVKIEMTSDAMPAPAIAAEAPPPPAPVTAPPPPVAVAEVMVPPPPPAPAVEPPPQPVEAQPEAPRQVAEAPPERRPPPRQSAPQPAPQPVRLNAALQGMESFTLEGRTTPPEALDIARNRRPNYPEASRRRGEQGVVRVELFVDPAGRVANVRVTESSGFAALDAAALEAVRDWRFRPAERAGLPVAASITTAVHFRLETARR